MINIKVELEFTERGLEMISEDNERFPNGSHLLAQLRLRNYFVKHIIDIIKSRFPNHPKYDEFENLLKKQNNFEVVNCLYIIAQRYRNKPRLLDEMINILTKRVG